VDLEGACVETSTAARVTCLFFKWGRPPAFIYLYCHVCRHAVVEGLHKGGFPALFKYGVVACAHPGSRRERLPRVMNPQ